MLSSHHAPVPSIQAESEYNAQSGEARGTEADSHTDPKHQPDNSYKLRTSCPINCYYLTDVLASLPKLSMLQCICTYFEIQYFIDLEKIYIFVYQSNIADEHKVVIKSNLALN